MTSTILTDYFKSFKTLNLYIKDKILVIELNRPKSLNAMNRDLFNELGKAFNGIEKTIMPEVDIRCVILKGNGKNFTSGLDLKSDILTSIQGFEDKDVARKAFRVQSLVKDLQFNLSAIENNPLPVICAIEGYCLGGGTSIITCADVRLTTKSAKFSVREIEIGLAADIGVIQRIGKQCGNDSLLRQVIYTGEIFNGDVSKEIGLVSKVFDTAEDLYKYAFELASTISSKSPIPLMGLKQSLNYSRDNNVANSLDNIALMNSAMIQTEDIKIAVMGTLMKQKKEYPKF